MSESLRSILGTLDFGRDFSWTYRQVEAWPEGQLEQCLATGMLVPAEPSRQIDCADCGQRVDVDLASDRGTGCLASWLLCGSCGPYQVPLECVSRWRLDFPRFLERLCVACGVSGNRQEVVTGQVWRLGKRHCAGASRSVYFARRLWPPDVLEVLAATGFPAGAIVLVPCEHPSPALRMAKQPTFVRLTDALGWEGDRLEFDLAQVEAQIQAVRSTGEKQAGPSRRASRLSVIEGLKRELAAHLRSARDHTFSTRQRTGGVQRLPRPTQEFLARQLGVSKATVSRCLDDAAAGELRRLWEAAGDPDRLLHPGDQIAVW